MSLNQLAGILPAVIFPAATAVQLVRMIRRRSSVGVSVPTWLLFGVANLAIYFYAERYTEWQAILGMLVTGALDFAIAILALVWPQPAEESADDPVRSAVPAPNPLLLQRRALD